jgi:hypothetical protein
MAILASTRIRQNWRIFGDYSNSTNLPASGHCLPLSVRVAILFAITFLAFKKPLISFPFNQYGTIFSLS